MLAYKTPGVFVEEIAAFPPSVVSVATAIPAFIGYTEKQPSGSIEAYRVNSFKDYEILFGGAFPETFSAAVEQDGATGEFAVSTFPSNPETPAFWLYYSLQMFYANGGGPCYIVSVGKYDADTNFDALLDSLIDGLNVLNKEDEPTLILFPDAVGAVDSSNLAKFYSVFQQALLKCSELKDRFTLIDLHRGDQDIGLLDGVIQEFRDNIGNNHLSYGAAYYPWLLTSLRFAYDEAAVTITGTVLPESDTVLKYDTTELASLEDPPGDDDTPMAEEQKRKYYENRSLFHLDNAAYSKIKERIESFRVKLPPSGAMAGIYARVDNERGVFKAPANVSLNSVIRPLVNVDNIQQDGMNEHSTGKSINAIRSFTGKGILVWGARTLDGNSNEWRYISVRRFFLFAEESIKKAIEPFVFEANNENTWIRVRGLIENFLTQQWKAGALAGSTTDQAFFVQIGLGETMSAVDILEGRLIVVVGMAAVRPAEFIILKFTHKLQEA